MLRLLLYFLGAALVAGILAVMVLVMFFEFKLAFIISSLVGLIFGLFALGFTQRILGSQQIEINAGNKHPERPLKWYEERIRAQINDMRFLYAGKDSSGIERYQPRALYKVFEPEIFLEVTPYLISVKASRLMMRIICDYVEMDCPAPE